MKQDLDRLMQEKDLDALWITGPANHNPALVYFTGVANITRADLIKKRGEPPVRQGDAATATSFPQPQGRSAKAHAPVKEW